jgi:2-keto-4-pentenoate hydratase/2-oxohepta-3-ene-1,7-dioic acid hydratase in catechol pathway
MRDGDICEIEIEGIGTLRNPVRNDMPLAGAAA